MPLTAAQTVTAMAAQPTVTSTGPLKVTVELLFDTSKPFIPSTLLTALTTAYGAGKVASDKDTVAQNTYSFRIIP